MTDPITTPAQMREAAALAIPDTIEIYRAIKASGARRRADIANAISEQLNPLRRMVAALPVAEQQAIRDKALDDAAQAASNRAAYWWNEATAANDAGHKKLSLIYEAKALASIETAAAIRAMKGKPE